MKEKIRITICILIPIIVAALIWLITGFCRWDFDLSTMESNERGGLIFGWISATIILYCIGGMAGLFESKK